MGLFSKTSVQVFARTFPLVQSSSWGKQDAILYAILTNTSISEALTDSAFSSMRFRMPRFRKYAREHYTLGLPNAALHNINQIPNSDLSGLIDQEYNLSYGNVISFSMLTTMNAALAVLPYLVSTRGLDATSNTLQSHPEEWEFPETYLEHEVVVTPSIAGIVISDDGKSVDISYTATMQHCYFNIATREIYSEGEWVYLDVPLSEYDQEYVENIVLPVAYEMDEQYYVTCFHALDSEGNLEEDMTWWFYAVNSGKYSALDLSSALVQEESSYPVIPLRYENEWIGGETYTTGKKMLDILDIGYDDLVDNLTANPDLDEIDNAYVMFGINLQTQDSALLSYLVDFFHTMSSSGSATIWDQMKAVGSTGTIDKTGSYTFNDVDLGGYSEDSYVLDTYDSEEDSSAHVTNPSEITSIDEYGLKIQLKWERIVSYVVEEVIGNKGTCTKEFVDVGSIMSEDRNEIYDLFTDGSSQVILKKQITSTLCRVILITNLVHYNYGIYSEREVISTNIMNLMNDEEENNFIIPLYHPTMLSTPKTEVDYIYHNSVFLVITGYVVTHLRWYQQEWFVLVVMVAMVVISIYTFGQSMTAFAAWLAGMAGAASAGTMALLLYVFTPLLKMLIIGAITKGIVEVLGPLGSIIAAFIVFAFTGYMSTDAMAALAPAASKFSANYLLQFSMRLASDSVAQLDEEIEETKKEYQAELDDQEEQWEFLQERRDLLLPESLIPINFLRSAAASANYDMSDADELYSRTHVGNVGTLVLSVIENYVNVSLLLPKSTV